MGWFVENAPLIALIFFVGVFAGITFWVLQPSRKDSLQALGNIPLEQEESHGEE